MSKKEYLDQLEHLLSDISQEERQAAIEYFTDYLEDAGPDGEQEAMEHLGTPAQVAAAVKEGLSNDSESGHFTESGYESGTEAGRYAVVKAGKFQKAARNTGPAGNSWNAGNTGHAGNSWNAGNAGHAGNSWNAGNAEPAGDAREKETRGEETGRSGAYGRTERRERGYEDRERRQKREQRRGIGWLLILIGGVICIGIPLVSVLGSVFAAVVAAVAAVAIGGFAVALGLAAVGITLLVIGIMKAVTVLGMGLMLIGGGFLCLAFAALALAAGIWMWGRVIPWAARAFIRIFQRIFRIERRRV
ncbi:MAG: DUF1700 domain-containing protein [Lachnospiraceae bacterium]|nr:DUF1700 domain-containing protein [Lachnospiraceae bacterium]